MVTSGVLVVRGGWRSFCPAHQASLSIAGWGAGPGSEHGKERKHRKEGERELNMEGKGTGEGKRGTQKDKDEKRERERWQHGWLHGCSGTRVRASGTVHEARLRYA